jgi:hypothetical protein
MPITPQVLDELLKDYKTPEDMLGSNGLLQQLTKALVERALEGDTDSSPRLPAARREWRQLRQLAQW